MKKIEANDPLAHSADIVGGNIEQLQSLFPEAVKEGKIDFDVLKQLLGSAVDERDEKYGLNWFGKRRARQLALTPSMGTLRPCPDESIEWDTTQNLMIDGDNLEALKLLQKSYAGKIKVIYIDPPYNTGKDFVYPDNFRDSIKNYFEVTGQVEGGRKITSNTETSGRFHTDWLNMIYPRLQLARPLLRQDGLIFVSIDDGEIANTRLLLDEIFGEENFVGIFSVNSTPNARDYGHIGKMHEYIIMYAKDIMETETNLIPEKDKKFRFSDSAGGFNVHPLYNSNEAFTSTNRRNLYYPFYLSPKPINSREPFFPISLEKKPGDVEIYPPLSEKGGVQFVWRWGRDKATADLNKEIIGYKTEDGDFRIVQKMRHSAKLIRSLLIDTAFATRRGTSEVEELFGKKVFTFPKPVELIKQLLIAGSSGDDLVLDFFSGSATLAHSLIDLNATDGANRRFILIQLPEPLDNTSEAYKAGFKSVAEIGKERVRRVIGAQKPAGQLFHANIGFRVFKLDSSNIRVWDPNCDDIAGTLEESVEHLKTDRSEQDILFELLLKLGLELTVPMATKKITGKTVYDIGAGTLMACLDAKIATKDVEKLAHGIAEWHKQLAPSNETVIVFRDSAFENDVAKTNLTEIIKQAGGDEKKVIVRSL